MSQRLAKDPLSVSGYAPNEGIPALRCSAFQQSPQRQKEHRLEQKGLTLPLPLRTGRP